MKTLSLVVLGLAMAVATGAAFNVPPGKGFMSPEFARIMLFHLPCAFASVITLIGGAYLSVQWLRKREIVWDFRASAMNELCLTFILLTLATGILFSKIQWGDWWHGDPRQWSFLMVALMFSAYFLLRQSITDPVRRATNSAAYAATILLPTLFLTFVFPRLKGVQDKSLHPNSTVPKWEMSREYSFVFITIFVMLVGVSYWLYRMRVRALELDAQFEEQNGQLDFSSPSARTHMVRPVSLRMEDGPQGE